MESGWTMVTIQTSRQMTVDEEEVKDKFTLVSLLENLQYQVKTLF